MTPAKSLPPTKGSHCLASNHRLHFACFHKWNYTVYNLLGPAASLSIMFGQSRVLRVVEVHSDFSVVFVVWTHCSLSICCRRTLG